MDERVIRIRNIDSEIDSINKKISELNTLKKQLLGKKLYLRKELKICALIEEKIGICDYDDISDILEVIRAKGYISGEKV